jgi:hypothetical protein
MIVKLTWVRGASMKKLMSQKVWISMSKRDSIRWDNNPLNSKSHISKMRKTKKSMKMHLLKANLKSWSWMTTCSIDLPLRPYSSFVGLMLRIRQSWSKTVCWLWISVNKDYQTNLHLYSWISTCLKWTDLMQLLWSSSISNLRMSKAHQSSAWREILMRKLSKLVWQVEWIRFYLSQLGKIKFRNYLKKRAWYECFLINTFHGFAIKYKFFIFTLIYFLSTLTFYNLI